MRGLMRVGLSLVSILYLCVARMCGKRQSAEELINFFWGMKPTSILACSPKYVLSSSPSPLSQLTRLL